MPTELTQKIHEKSLVIDTLSFPYIMDDPYYEKVKEGGVDGAVITAAISEGFQETIETIAQLKKRIAKNPALCLATSEQAIRDAKQKQQLALIFGFQDISPIENHLSFLSTFHELGVRIIQLTYTGGNMAGDGCGERTNSKLKYFGLEVIEEMNRLGLAIDLSHTGDASTLDAIQHTKAPVLFTHSNCRSLCNNQRNKTDEQILAMARTGGYMGLTPHPALVSQGKEPTIEDFLDHIDYLAELVGTDYIGIGLDYIEGLKTSGQTPESVKTWRTRRPDIFGTIDDFFNKKFTADLDRIEKLPNLTRGLLRRGYSETDIEKILGGNFLRVFKEIVG